MVRLVEGAGARPIGQRVDEARGDGRIDHGVAGVRGPHRPSELRGLGVLEQVAGGPGLERRQQPLVLEEARQHDHAGLGSPPAPLAQLPHRADAVEPRHHEVHQDHVGLEFARRSSSASSPSCRLADDLEPVLNGQERAQPLAHDRVVVDDEDRDRVSHRLRARSGPSCRLPGAERIRSRPRSSRARSSIEVSPRCLRAELGSVGIEPDPVVGDLDDERAVRAADAHGHVLGVGVAHRVVERLVGDPQQRQLALAGLDRRTPASTWSSMFVPCARPSISTSLRSAPSRPSRSSSGGRRPRISDAQLVERLASQLAQPLDLRPRRDQVAVHLGGGGLGGEHHAEQLLADHVVELERQAVALGQDRQLAALLVQAGVGDRDRRRAPPAARSAPDPRRRTSSAPSFSVR